MVLESFPRSFTVSVTGRCNLDCIMCEAKRIPWEIPDATLEEIESFFPYLEHVMWQGGEVFLRQGFVDLLRRAAAFPRMKQVITSNGLLLDDAIMDALVAQPDLTLTFSIDAADKKLYEAIRKGARFDKLVENIRVLNEKRKKTRSAIKLNINVTVMRSNYRYLRGIIDFAKLHDFSFVFLTTVTGNEHTGENIFAAGDREALAYLERTMDDIERAAREYDIVLHNWLPVRRTPPQPASPACPAAAPAAAGRLLCHAPWQRVYIDWHGNLFPDCMCLPDKPAGTVLSGSIRQAWNGDGMQHYRRVMRDHAHQSVCKPDCMNGRIPARYLKFTR
jgi:MoaA/NifB/PqqE/SkfB family radical SAM enzyme